MWKFKADFKSDLPECRKKEDLCLGVGRHSSISGQLIGHARCNEMSRNGVTAKSIIPNQGSVLPYKQMQSIDTDLH
ncbi:hypothetical protein DSO57_1024293 [Entomophthora muscae]|uniref:Uncharacterized protein n=1 Tax=Entomophthora muscae TaxID=34485 RepID=A0ACC2TQ31_9FUNG|nr:hypothetical protein DSO57_1024293 [Entomophthora muscae]